MTKEEFRNSLDYAELMKEIVSYPHCFRFTIYWSDIPVRKANALKVLLGDAKKNGIVESEAFGLSLAGELVEERFVRL